MKIAAILGEARACRVCEPALPLGARPLVQGSANARILVIGQAPGAVAHETGIAWNDRSGVRLRDWLGLAHEAFYDPAKVALMPMGFCYPGTGRAGDLAPRPECAPLWHARLLRGFRRVGLTVIVGRHAAERYADGQTEGDGSITSLARAFDRWLPERIVIPHPSPRNGLWLKRNPWFESRAVPALRKRVAELLEGRAPGRAPAPKA